MAELSPARVLEELKNNGVTHVVWLPDSETNFRWTSSRSVARVTPFRRLPAWPPGEQSPSFSSRTPA